MWFTLSMHSFVFHLCNQAYMWVFEVFWCIINCYSSDRFNFVNPCLFSLFSRDVNDYFVLYGCMILLGMLTLKVHFIHLLVFTPLFTFLCVSFKRFICLKDVWGIVMVVLGYGSTHRFIEFVNLLSLLACVGISLTEFVFLFSFCFLRIEIAFMLFID